MFTFNDIEKVSSCVIARGSIVYGTAGPDSDIDMYAICDDGVCLSDFGDDGNDDGCVECVFTEDDNVFDVQIVHEGWFVDRIREQDIAVLETLWQEKTPYDYKYVLFHKRFEPKFSLDAWKLRVWISSKCNNSWAKACKKLTVEKDYSPYIGRKSLWHVFRMYDFAEQILTTGRINDYGSAWLIGLYDEIVGSDRTWSELKTAYQPLRNRMASRLRELAGRPIG